MSLSLPMSNDLAALCSSLASSIHHDTWFAALTDRVRADVLTRHRVVVTAPLRLRVELGCWRDWFAARPHWSLYIGTDHLMRTVALGFEGSSGTSVRLKPDLSARRAENDRLREILQLGEDAYTPEPRDSGVTRRAEIAVLGAPESVQEVSAQLRAAFAPAGSTVHWYGEACALAAAAGLAAPSDATRRYSAAEVFHAGEAGRAGQLPLRGSIGFV